MSAELRWVLLLAGLVVLALIALLTKYEDRLRERLRGWRKTQPAAAVPAECEPEVETEAGSADPEPSAPAGPDSKIVTLRLMAKDRAGFPAERLVLALRERGLRHGRYGIFHRLAGEDEDAPLFSVANLVEPGSFDLTRLKADRYRGISLFTVLPVAGRGVEAFDEMTRVARDLALELQGELLDEAGSSLSIQRERFLREEVIQFEHRRDAPA